MKTASGKEGGLFGNLSSKQLHLNKTMGENSAEDPPIDPSY